MPERLVLSRSPREALDFIGHLLAAALSRAEPELWHILTGLRGPDRRKDRKAFKGHGVTDVIRGLAFPKTAAVLAARKNGKRRPGTRPAFATKGTARQALEQLLERGKGGHWAVHAARALHALERWP